MLWKVSGRLTENIEFLLKFEYIVPGIFLHQPANRKILIITHASNCIKMMLKCQYKEELLCHS